MGDYGRVFADVQSALAIQVVQQLWAPVAAERANILAFIARDGDGDLAAICAQVFARRSLHMSRGFSCPTTRIRVYVW